LGALGQQSALLSRAGATRQRSRRAAQAWTRLPLSGPDHSRRARSRPNRRRSPLWSGDDRGLGRSPPPAGAHARPDGAARHAGALAPARAGAAAVVAGLAWTDLADRFADRLALVSTPLCGRARLSLPQTTFGLDNGAPPLSAGG